jgi:hypothetical protein
LNDIDTLASALLEQAKRFLEIASGIRGQEGEVPYCIAALLTAFSSLEAHINAVAAELADRPGTGLLEKSTLLEKELRLKSGKYVLTDTLKMYRLEDRINFVVSNYSKKEFPPKEPWWADVVEGTRLRNDLVHPKAKVEFDIATVRRSLIAIVELLNYVYLAVYGKGHPSYNRGTHSKLAF